MIDLSKKSTYQYFGAGLAGFAAIMLVGSVSGLHHGASGPAKVAFSSRPAPQQASAAPARAASPAPLASAGVAAASPLPVLPADAARGDSGNAAAAGAQAAADPSAPSAAAPAKLAAAGRVDMSGSASSSASASAGAVAAAKGQPAAERKPLLPAKLDLSKNAPAALASVHYGVSGRSELMGRAAGPVYNFSGNSTKSGGQIAADNAAASGALQQVDAVEKQIDSTDMSNDQKAQIHQQLDQARSAAAPSAP